MQPVLSPFVTMYRTQIEASRRFADALFSGAEKMDRVLIEATHHAFTRQLNFAEAITSVRDPQSAANTLQSNLLSRTPDEALNYQKEIMRICAEMQNEIGRSLHDYIDQLSAGAASTQSITPMQAMQAKTRDAMFNPVSSMFSVWESAFKEATALTKKNMSAAQTTMEDAATKAMENASNFTMAAANGMSDAANVATRGAATGSTIAGRSMTGDDGDKRGSLGKRK